MTVLLGTANLIEEAATFFGVSVAWTGWDGSEWDLTDYEHGSVRLATGVAGLLWPEVSSLVTTSPALDGQRLQGVSALARPVSLAVHIKGRDSTAFVDLLAAFARSWSPLRTGVLSVSTGSTIRRIRLRLMPDGGALLHRDPVHRGEVLLDITAIADDPYFTGDALSGEWAGDGEIRDFLSDSPGYLLWVSPAQTFGNATISNPGDVPAWPVWSITASTASLSGMVTVDGGKIGLPTIPAGKTLRVDTDPARGYADMGHIDSTGVFVAESEADGLLNPYDPRPIPVGEGVPVVFDLTGPGRVTAEIVARYWLGIGNA